MKVDRDRNVQFWDNEASNVGEGRAAFAGMLMAGREFESIYRIRAEQEHLLTLFTPTPESKVLEIGSGGGRWGLFFADKVKEFVGLDISPQMVEIAESERIERGLSNVRYFCEDFLDFDSTEKYELIYFSGVLQYMDDATVDRCLRKASDLLAEGGVVISRDSVQLTERVVKTGRYPVIYRAGFEYVEMFAAAGFSNVYSAVSYDHKRFTGVASRLYNVPGVGYRTAIVLREIMCKINEIIGQPAFLNPSGRTQLDDGGNPQEHRYFKYQRNDVET